MNKSDYKPMVCPVCSDFYFSDLTEEDRLGDPFQCSQCGWIYSLKQVEEPNWEDPNVNYSLNEYRERYRQKKMNDPSYNYSEDTYDAVPHLCPVCGKTSFPDHASFEVCPVCGWEDDPVMEEEPNDWAGSANDLCLNDYRKRYYETIEKNPAYRFDQYGLPQ